VCARVRTCARVRVCMRAWVFAGADFGRVRLSNTLMPVCVCVYGCMWHGCVDSCRCPRAKAKRVKAKKTMMTTRCVCPCVSVSVCLCVCVSVCLAARLSVCLSLCVGKKKDDEIEVSCLCVCVCVCVCVYDIHTSFLKPSPVLTRTLSRDRSLSIHTRSLSPHLPHVPTHTLSFSRYVHIVSAWQMQRR
jgi:hypothetical protein